MRNQLKNIVWSWAFLLTGVAYIAGFFIDLTGDGGLYAAITRQMVESGDWFNLKINGEPYYQKPHLIFWLAGIGVQLFGNTNVAFKLFPVLYGWLGFYFIYRLGKTLFSTEAGKIAALFMATSQVFFLYSFDIHTDIVLQTGVLLALWQLAEYLIHKKTIHFILGFTGVGLAMLAKGPVGAVLPFFVVLIYLILKKDWKQLFHPKWFAGIMIVLLIISPTLIHLYQNFHWLGIEFYFITNNLGRISGEYAGSSTDPFYYLYNSLWIFLPWTILIFAAIYNEIKSWLKKDKPDIWGISVLCSVLLYLIVISIARGKAPNYFLIATGPFLVVTVKWLVKCSSSQPRKFKAVLYIHNTFNGLLFLFLVTITAFLSPDFFIWLILLSAISAFCLYLFSGKKVALFNRAMFTSVLIIGLLNFYLNIKLVPELSQYQGARQALEIFEKNRDEKDKLYSWDLEEYELFFMAEKNPENIDSWDKLHHVVESPGNWLYTNQVKLNDIKKLNIATDTIININYRGLNELNWEFINPKTRDKSLKMNYLILTK